jgi:hypothetical protein
LLAKRLTLLGDLQRAFAEGRFIGGVPVFRQRAREKARFVR